MSDEYVDPFEGKTEIHSEGMPGHVESTEEGIQYVDDAGKPEEPPTDMTDIHGEPIRVPPPNLPEPPALTRPKRPADLPLEAPTADPVEELPPDPGFQVIPMKGRPPRVTYDGIPVGIWINDNFYHESGAEIEQRLTMMGLDPALARWYGKQREGRIAADRELAADPVVQGFAQAEARHDESTAAMREAFVAAQRKKNS